jgi:hypothetical protein
MKEKIIPSSTPLVKKLDARSSRRSFAFLYITNECNLCCAHCSFQSAPNKADSHIETGVLLRTLDELYGIHDITITGGEPLLHPGFEKILARAAKNASIVYLMTNGIHLLKNEIFLKLAKEGNTPGLKKLLIKAMNGFPDNLHLFFPLDSFHLNAFKPFVFLLEGLAEVAKEWNRVRKRPFIGFISNEVSPQKSEALMHRFHVKPYCHVGTATFSPWREASSISSWYLSYTLNRMPFPGGVYINHKGVYVNEAALLMDLREGIETPLKIGALNPQNKNKTQLNELFKKAKYWQAKA